MKKTDWISLSYCVFGLTTGLVRHEVADENCGEKERVIL